MVGNGMLRMPTKYGVLKPYRREALRIYKEFNKMNTKQFIMIFMRFEHIQNPSPPPLMVFPKL